MISQAGFARDTGPDVLEVISNLSSDEIFTPPRVVNEMLDLLPDWVWTDPDLRWLDPGCKTGIFLREVTRRLMDGLSVSMPDDEARLHHILQNMVFGVAITDLTALMSRRTLYCSRDAGGEHSAVLMASRDGNVWFENISHTFNAAGRCTECPGLQGTGLDEQRDHHAYGLTHEVGRASIEEMFGMKFDVVLGNPPYQMEDGGHGASASPIYHDFVQQAIDLNPRFVLMITPSRWFVGGKGLDAFRGRMLADRRIRTVVDFLDARSLFPTINLNGGVNFFLWDREWSDECEVTFVHPDGSRTTAQRNLDEHDVFIRMNEAVPIVEKIRSKEEPTFETKVSSLKPFGLRTFEKGLAKKPSKPVVRLFANGTISWFERDKLPAGEHLVDVFKVLIPAATDGNENFPLPVLTRPIIAKPGEACTETYLVIGPCNSQTEAENLAAYMRTRFFRFLLSLKKNAQHNSRDKFSFIPDIPLDTRWTDELLYNRYGISPEEQALIAKMIRELAE